MSLPGNWHCGLGYSRRYLQILSCSALPDEPITKYDEIERDEDVKEGSIMNRNIGAPGLFLVQITYRQGSSPTDIDDEELHVPKKGFTEEFYLPWLPARLSDQRRPTSMVPSLARITNTSRCFTPLHTPLHTPHPFTILRPADRRKR